MATSLVENYHSEIFHEKNEPPLQQIEHDINNKYNDGTYKERRLLTDLELQQYSCKLVGDAFRERIDKADAFIGHNIETDIDSVDYDEDSQFGMEDSFFVADLGMIYRQYRRWIRNLPRVEPMYAIKCNGDSKVVELFARLGMGFDCASMEEIRSCMQDHKVDASKIIYANPCKTPSYLRYAKQHGVGMMTFDNADELYKCKKYYSNAKLLLRIMTDDSTALCRLSVKFGASIDSSFELLKLAHELGLNVVGVAFHVGSGASDNTSFVKAVEDSKRLFDFTRDHLGYEMTILDVGGGFESDTFEATANVLRQSLDTHFDSNSVRIIAEPGRFFVANAFSLATHVIGRRWVDEELGQAMLYVNDGVYGNLNCIMFDHQHPIPRILKAKTGNQQEQQSQFLYGSELNCQGRYHMSVWGPTCDGLDCITQSCNLPLPVDVGDWLYFDNMGAYTLAATTSFNGFGGQCNVVYVCSDSRVQRLVEV